MDVRGAAHVSDAVRARTHNSINENLPYHPKTFRPHPDSGCVEQGKTGLAARQPLCTSRLDEDGKLRSVGWFIFHRVF